jgi:hypothetical protein
MMKFLSTPTRFIYRGSTTPVGSQKEIGRLPSQLGSHPKFSSFVRRPVDESIQEDKYSVAAIAHGVLSYSRDAEVVQWVETSIRRCV